MDNVFRIIIVCGFLSALPIGLYHRLKARTDEPIDRTQEGLFILLTLRPIALVRLIGLFTWLSSPALMNWSRFPLPLAARWVGVGCGVATILLLVWTFVSLGRNITDTVVTRRDASLVTHGPYRFVRHPLYLAVALCVTADSLVTENWFLLVTGVATFLLLVKRTTREEENLIARFGDDYRNYMARTGRFFPAAGFVGSRSVK